MPKLREKKNWLATHRDALAVDAVHHIEGRAQVWGRTGNRWFDMSGGLGCSRCEVPPYLGARSAPARTAIRRTDILQIGVRPPAIAALHWATRGTLHCRPLGFTTYMSYALLDFTTLDFTQTVRKYRQIQAGDTRKYK